MDKALGSGGFILGMVVGFLGGVAVQAARGAWKDVTATKAKLPGLRRTAYANSRKATVWAVVLLGLAIVVTVRVFAGS